MGKLFLHIHDSTNMGLSALLNNISLHHSHPGVEDALAETQHQTELSS